MGAAQGRNIDRRTLATAAVGGVVVQATGEWTRVRGWTGLLLGELVAGRVVLCQRAVGDRAACGIAASGRPTSGATTSSTLAPRLSVNVSSAVSE
jgi:hypothetical protein